MKVNLVLKRAIDIVASIFGLIVLIPVFFVIAVAIKLDSKGPVLFKQKRLTKNGQVFEMFKFRSMVENAEQKGTGLFNYENDPRVTKIGRFLRDYSLDELPQLINVLQGSVSLVGPRPPVTYELGDYTTLNKKYRKRFQMKAGITGLAQIKGRNNISWDEKVEFDNKYVDLFKKYGILFDIKILFETITNIFKSKNIYEVKYDESMDDVEAAKLAEEEAIKLAHLPDSEV